MEVQQILFFIKLSARKKLIRYLSEFVAEFMGYMTVIQHSVHTVSKNSEIVHLEERKLWYNY